MYDIEQFINHLLKNSGINEEDMEDLKSELSDHLNMARKEYVAKGFSEKESIELAIKDFGENEDLAIHIRDCLPSKNRVKTFSIHTLLRALLGMGLVYSIFIILDTMTLNIHKNPLLFNTILSFILVITSLRYAIKELRIKKNVIKSIFIINSIFFVVEKFIMSTILYFMMISRMNQAVSINWFINAAFHSYLFDLIYITTYWIFTFIGILFIHTKYTDLIENKINSYNSSLLTNISVVLSSILFVVYYLIPNRWYFLRKVITLIINEEITEVHKNIFYMTINNSLIIPNIGLLGFIILGISLWSRKKNHNIQQS